MAYPISQSVPPHAHGVSAVPSGAPAHQQPGAVPAFNGRGASLAPPPQQYFAQPTPRHGASVPVPADTAQQSPTMGNVKRADPTVTTKNSPDISQTPENGGSSKADELVKHWNDDELLSRGHAQLEQARKAYTAYGQNNLAHQARQALDPFIQCANNARSNFPITGANWFKSSEGLVKSLKEIKPLPGAPKDMTVTIQFPGEEVISLIPPGEGLKKKTPTEIYQCYIHAFGVMDKKVAEFDNGNNQALAEAETKLNQVVEMLKAIRKETDKRKLMNNLGPNRPSGSQLENMYYDFTEKGVTISAVAKGEEFPYHEAKIHGKVPDPTTKPDETTTPTLTGTK